MSYILLILNRKKQFFQLSLYNDYSTINVLYITSGFIFLHLFNFIIKKILNSFKEYLLILMYLYTYYFVESSYYIFLFSVIFTHF